MPKHAVPAAESGLPKSTETCPVAALARLYKLCIERQDQLDKAYKYLEEDAKNNNRQLETAICEHRAFIEEHASHLLAKSGLGALFQLNLLHDTVHDFEQFELTPESMAKRFRRIDRLAYSLFAFIEANADVNASDFNRDFYMSDRLNPHLHLANALADHEGNEG